MFNTFNSQNLLPHHGEMYMLGNIKTYMSEISDTLSYLKQLPWQDDVVKMFGKTIIPKRKIIWMADPFSGKPYSYSGTSKIPVPWDPVVMEIKMCSEKIYHDILGKKVLFNSCLLNLYPTGQESMGWHRDNEQDLVMNAPILSVSLGASRRMIFRFGKEGEKREITLQHGDILVMQGEIQKFWYHSIPKSATTSEARISLTFRCLSI